MITNIVLLGVLILLSGLFSGSEIAFVSLTPARVQSLVQQNARFAKLIQRLKENQQRLIIVILIGNNLVNVSASVLTTVVALDAFGNQSLAAVTGVLTLLVLIFGEIIPKAFAQNHAQGLATLTAYPLLWMEYLFFPLVWVLEYFIKSLLAMSSKSADVTITEDELRVLVDIGKQEGTFEAQEQNLIENVLEFSDTRVEEIMTVRADMDVLDDSTTISEAFQFLRNHTHTRIPIFHSSLDNIVGVLTMHSLIQHYDKPMRDKELGDISLMSPLIVPYTRMISSLFREFQQKRIHMAIVVDEHGTVMGLVTLEDILEEIVGEIEDEVDEPEAEDKLIQRIDSTTVIIDGAMNFDELSELLKIEPPNGFEAHKSISYLILEKLQRFPRRGEHLDFHGLRCTIVKMGNKRIEEVKIEVLPYQESQEN